jgi:hypothetical protein
MLASIFALAIVAPLQGAPVAPRAEPDNQIGIADLMAALETAPLDDLQRERWLRELLSAEGGDEMSVSSVPLDPQVVERQLAAAIERQKERLSGHPQAEVAAARSALSGSFARLGGNVEAVLPGRTRRTIVVGAHYDAAPGSLGIVDNWAACLVLTKLAGALLDLDRQHTFVLVGFAGHELGGVGAESFALARRAMTEDPIDACVVLDCVGVSPPLLWWGGSSEGMGEFVGDVARRAKLQVRHVDFKGGGSDGCILRDAGFPVASLLGLAPHRVSLIHSPSDRKDAIDAAHLHAITRLTLELAKGLDGLTEPLRAAWVNEKLRIGAKGGRKPVVPEAVEWGAPAPAPSPAKPSASGEPSPAPAPSEKNPEDGSQP